MGEIWSLTRHKPGFFIFVEKFLFISRKLLYSAELFSKEHIL